MWIAAAGDYVAVGLHHVGLPAGPLRLLASPMDVVWVATFVAAPFAVALTIVIAFRHSRRAAIRAGVTVVVLASFVVTVVGPQMNTRMRFDLMRPDLDRAERLSMVTSNPFPDYYERLPVGLSYGSVNGLVSTNGHGQLFVPQWAGIPDPAGGYIYSPEANPESFDMWGMGCKKPVPLDGNWWACGMR